MQTRCGRRSGLALLGSLALAACAEPATAPGPAGGEPAALVASFDALALAAGDASSFGVMAVGLRGGAVLAPISFSARDDRIATVRTGWQDARPRALVRGVSAGTTYVIIQAVNGREGRGGLIDSVRVDVY